MTNFTNSAYQNTSPKYRSSHRQQMSQGPSSFYENSYNQNQSPVMGKENIMMTPRQSFRGQSSTTKKRENILLAGNGINGTMSNNVNNNGNNTIHLGLYGSNKNSQEYERNAWSNFNDENISVEIYSLTDVLDYYYLFITVVTLFKYRSRDQKHKNHQRKKIWHQKKNQNSPKNN